MKHYKIFHVDCCVENYHGILRTQVKFKMLRESASSSNDVDDEGLIGACVSAAYSDV
jgi:hypothetical protein